ncbi:MAG: 16S rRNA (cytosine1402-N4)-methyltransferase [Candidatus Berkelbacteria bacterium Licking1014_7]|uniref:Ribosomal RNA small subunit methyltransferase H n=1 Tax=Candidatus Berkelbacteria bacterium Licking1014_7 TaxID=2017147 RepID=A0A554LJU0_9BACT|nr:MAG: 16S rRNA (cytosine1402-N4)-methyltransferase [Candidatus Berkelbacteria bacterium Licking1014_7]
MNNNIYHKPILVQEILQLVPGNAKIIVDATCGTGGHTLAIARKFQDTRYKIQTFCIDYDSESIKVAKKRLEKYSGKIYPVRNSNANITAKQQKIISNGVKFICDNFTNIKKILSKQKADFILADLGFSSWQLAQNRGLAFSQNQPLDMRLNSRLTTTAADLINHLQETDLANLIYQNSGEKFSRQITYSIIRKRPIYTTGKLAEIIQNAIANRYKKQKIHPATRTFQALRIAVNQELENLEKFLQDATQTLAKNGILAIITFHSLEEKLVRNYFKKFKKTGDYQIITQQPISPSSAEIRLNPRSRSARLRVLKKIV